MSQTCKIIRLKIFSFFGNWTFRNTTVLWIAVLLGLSVFQVVVQNTPTYANESHTQFLGLQRRTWSRCVYFFLESPYRASIQPRWSPVKKHVARQLCPSIFWFSLFHGPGPNMCLRGARHDAMNPCAPMKAHDGDDSTIDRQGAAPDAWACQCDPLFLSEKSNAVRCSPLSLLLLVMRAITGSCLMDNQPPFDSQAQPATRPFQRHDNKRVCTSLWNSHGCV